MPKLKQYLVLHLLLALLSFAPVCSKMATRHPFLSIPFLLYYGGTLGILFIYALAWQQIIKRMPLTAAYANKAVTVVWGLLWGIVFFQDQISLLKLVGVAVILCGVILFAFAQEEEPNAPA